jgi:hypothetical protein
MPNLSVRWAAVRVLFRNCVFSLVMTVLFGAVDLLLTQPTFLRYEAAVTNVATCIFFAAGAFGRKPLIMEFAEISALPVGSGGSSTCPKTRRATGASTPHSAFFFREIRTTWPCG